jgi:chromosomal replication initiation ATPase DnaA
MKMNIVEPNLARKPRREAVACGQPKPWMKRPDQHDAHTRAHKRAILVASAPQLTPSMIRAVSVREIVRITASHFGVDATVVMGPSRVSPIAQARQVAMFVTHLLKDLSLSQIGMLIASRGHTTALYSICMVEQMCAADIGFAGEIEEIVAKIAFYAQEAV